MMRVQSVRDEASDSSAALVSCGPDPCTGLLDEGSLSHIYGLPAPHQGAVRSPCPKMPPLAPVNSIVCPLHGVAHEYAPCHAAHGRHPCGGTVRSLSGFAFCAVPAVSAVRRPAGGDRQAGGGGARRRGLPDAAGGDGFGQDFHYGQCDCPAGAAGHHLCSEQDTGRAAVQRVPRVLSEERSGVLRQLLRLLPARGLRAAARPVHREGQRDQRAHRADALVMHQEPAGAARRGDRGHRVGHLWHWRARELPPHGDDAARWRPPEPARRDCPVDPHAVPAQRPGFQPRPVPRARRHH